MYFHTLNPCTIPWKSFGISLMALSRFDSRPCCVYENKEHLRIFYVTDTRYNKRKWITCNSPYPILYNVNINENKDYWIFFQYEVQVYLLHCNKDPTYIISTFNPKYAVLYVYEWKYSFITIPLVTNGQMIYLVYIICWQEEN